MAKNRVGVLEVHETPKFSEPTTHCGQKIAEYLVKHSYARRLGKRLIKMLHIRAEDAIHLAKLARDLVQKTAERAERMTIGFWDGPFGIGNLLPFFKVQNPLMRPEKLHYEIPQAGECRSTCPARYGLRRKAMTVNKGEGHSILKEVLVSRTIHVSSRPLDFPAIAAALRA